MRKKFPNVNLVHIIAVRKSGLTILDRNVLYRSIMVGGKF